MTYWLWYKDWKFVTGCCRRSQFSTYIPTGTTPPAPAKARETLTRPKSINISGSSRPENELGSGTCLVQNFIIRDGAEPQVPSRKIEGFAGVLLGSAETQVATSLEFPTTEIRKPQSSTLPCHCRSKRSQNRFWRGNRPSSQ